jgi:quercetin dioxygenase-like cupin family protein
VLIALEPGQALGDHETKEGVLITVLEGSVRVRSGGEAVDGGAGCLFSFDADERRSISSTDGARLLMVFSPWPGPGHYRGSEKRS